MQRRRAHGKRDPHTYRKTPIFGITTAHTERDDKRIASRQLRAFARTQMGFDDPDEQTPRAHVGRPQSRGWGWRKDGKKYYGWVSDPHARRPVEYWHR